MDLARRHQRDFDEDGLAPPRQAQETATLADLDRVLRFTPPPVRPAPAPSSASGTAERGGLSGRDISRAIDLVQSAARTIRTADKRAREGDSRTQALLQRATEELAGAESRIQAAEARARAAEQRAKEAEARAVEAENWLRQIFSAISSELPPQA